MWHQNFVFNLTVLVSFSCRITGRTKKRLLLFETTDKMQEWFYGINKKMNPHILLLGRQNSPFCLTWEASMFFSSVFTKKNPLKPEIFSLSTGVFMQLLSTDLSAPERTNYRPFMHLLSATIICNTTGVLLQAQRRYEPLCERLFHSVWHTLTNRTQVNHEAAGLCISDERLFVWAG